MSTLELGIPDVRLLPGIDAEGWQRVAAAMTALGPAFVPVEPPHEVTGALCTRARELVTNAQRFLVEVTDAYYARPELRAEFQVNALLAPLLELEAERHVAAPMARFDAVLGADGGLRIIEVNPVGPRMRIRETLFHLTRELARAGLTDPARRLDELGLAMVRAILRHVQQAAPRPVIGALAPSGWFEDEQLLFRDVFARAGVAYVFGGPEHLEVTERELRLRGTRIDVLWADRLFYLGYQHAEFQHRAPAGGPDLARTPAQVAALVGDARFLAHVRRGSVATISPARAFLALPKSLLAWVHRADRPIDPATRAGLAAQVARTYGARERGEGAIPLEQAVRDRGAFVLKPCRSGASRGVVIGREAEADAWRAQLTACWVDPAWTLQDFHEPIRDARGRYITAGISGLDGELGGLFLRASPSLVLDARGDALIAGVP